MACAGVFASDINNYVLINNLVFDGTHSATVDIRSPNIPPVDFVAYRNNPSLTPTLPAYQLPTINTNGPDAKVPVVYKANISYGHYFTAKLKVGISGYASLGRNNYMYVDRNMAETPYFTLADEGKVNQFAIVVDGTYQYYKDGEITASYTWNDARDNTSFNGNVANSATLSLPVRDDPRDLSMMSYSDNQFRHKIIVYGTLPTFWGVTIGLRYSGIGGTRYSLLSGANSNADFVAGNNDLAYIFDRGKSSVPQNVRDGLTAILDNTNASQSIKDYINKYSDQIAERNGVDCYRIFIVPAFSLLGSGVGLGKDGSCSPSKHNKQR